MVWLFGGLALAISIYMHARAFRLGAMYGIHWTLKRLSAYDPVVYLEFIKSESASVTKLH